MSEIAKHPGGRPPKYTDEVLSRLAKSLKEWAANLAKKEKFGMLGDWCFDNDFDPKYFKRYADKHDEFKEAYEWAKAWQEHIVAKGALTQKLNARFAQFFLGCAHDWKTKDATDDKLLRSDFNKYLEIAKAEEQDKEEGNE